MFDGTTRIGREVETIELATCRHSWILGGAAPAAATQSMKKSYGPGRGLYVRRNSRRTQKEKEAVWLSSIPLSMS